MFLILFSSYFFLVATAGKVDPPYGSCLYDGLTMADPADPTAYYVCCDHFWLIKYCPNGEIFDKYKLTCVSPPQPGSPSPTNFHSFTYQEGDTTTTTTTIPVITTRRHRTRRPFGNTTMHPICQESAGQEGYKPNPADCRTYYQCVHNEWQLRNCGPGTQWKQAILGCDYLYGECSI